MSLTPNIPTCVSNHGLFRDHYLASRLAPELAQPDPAALAAFTAIAAAWAADEGTLTESEDNVGRLVGKMCKALGMIPSGQTKVKASDASQRIDITLFADAAAAQAFTQAKGSKKDAPGRYANALAVVEVEKLGAEFETGKNDNTNPSQQIANYLTFTKLPWGILTDGARWRLYRRFDPPNRTRYLEINLRDILNSVDIDERGHAFRGSVSRWEQGFRLRPSVDWRLFSRRGPDFGSVTNRKGKAERRISPQLVTLAFIRCYN